MHIEWEVRILNINKEEMIKRLESLGAEYKWEHVQKRYVYDFQPIVPTKWIRLRTNGRKTTLAIKNVASHTIDGMEELEVVVDNFEKTNLVLKELGYLPKSFQENKRRQYIFHGVEIDIDSWPLIPDYIEAEGKNEEEVMQVVKDLGFTKEDVTSKDVESIYLDYGIRLKEIETLKLEEERK